MKSQRHQWRSKALRPTLLVENNAPSLIQPIIESLMTISTMWLVILISFFWQCMPTTVCFDFPLLPFFSRNKEEEDIFATDDSSFACIHVLLLQLSWRVFRPNICYLIDLTSLNWSTEECRLTVTQLCKTHSTRHQMLELLHSIVNTARTFCCSASSRFSPVSIYHKWMGRYEFYLLSCRRFFITYYFACESTWHELQICFTSNPSILFLPDKQMHGFFSGTKQDWLVVFSGKPHQFILGPKKTSTNYSRLIFFCQQFRLLSFRK